MNFGRFCESGFWMAKVAMNRMSEGNTFYGRKLHITSYVEQLSRCGATFISTTVTASERLHGACPRVAAAVEMAAAAVCLCPRAKPACCDCCMC